MSGGNTVATATVLLDTGMVQMQEPTTTFKLEAPAGLVTITADCEDGKCKAVAFDNVPSFVYEVDYEVQVPGFGTVTVDIAWGGMHYVLVDVASVGLSITHEHAPELIKLGEEIKRTVQNSYDPIHHENPGMHGVTILEFTEPLQDSANGSKCARNTVVVSPGRLDRCPCGTGTSARMAVLHARGLLKTGQVFRYRSIIDTEFVCEILGETRVGP
jgi:proline racemase